MRRRWATWILLRSCVTRLHRSHPLFHPSAALLPTVRCLGTTATLRDDRGGGQRVMVEKRWREFFTDPSQWWDNRMEKGNPGYPDFRHKKSKEPLWIDGKFNPSWVESELAAMVPGTVQLNTFSWNTRLASCVKNGRYEEVIRLFQQMQQEGIIPDTFTYVRVLNACAGLQALEEGRHIHTWIIQSCCEFNVFVGSSLVDMYAKCGSIEDAQKVFDRMPTRNVVSWNAMILGYVKCGQGQKALELYRQMQSSGVQPDSVTFVGLLNACASAVALEEGRGVHEQIIRSGCESEVYVGSSLVDMYAKCGSIEDAQRVFDRMPIRNVVSWNAIILGHVKCGQGWKALALSHQMQEEGVEPDPVTFLALLNACASVGTLEEGRRVEEQIIQSSCKFDVFVGNSLVDMYAKCGSIDDAWRVFNNMSTRNVVAWSSMILGHVKCGQGQQALALYRQMQLEGVQPNPVTFVGVLNACASVVALEEGRNAHEQIIQSGFESDAFVGSSLVDMYAKCGSIEDAQSVFIKMRIRDVVAWTAMILGHVKCGQGHKALALFQQMQQEGVEPNPVTFVGAVAACASAEALEEGRHVEKQIIQSGYESDVFISNSLIDMYSKCGSIKDASRVFHRMPTKDVVSWTAMLGGFAMHGHAKEAVGHFEMMCEGAIELNSITFVSLLSACSHAGLVDEGLQYIESMGFVYSCPATLKHYSCTVDLLGRAGYLEEAEELIKTMSCEPDVALWMTLLGASRVHRNVEVGERIAKKVLELDPGNTSGYVVLSNM
ncbi:unnamed protein product [Sphagnum balticum]